jgi:hypothetical protein
MHVSLNVVGLLLNFDQVSANEITRKITDFTRRGRRLLNREQNRIHVVLTFLSNTSKVEI